ncbi:potassium channel subfamily K member 15-like isoform X2 [Oculina patagonica]
MLKTFISCTCSLGNTFDERSLKKKVTANTTKQMNELVKKSILRATLLYTYAFLGGCIFYLIERKPEKNKDVYSRLSQELQREIVIQYNISINQSDFKRFMQRAFDAVTIGNKADWSILNGLTFTITSLTTIGYGHITPETALGQIVTVVYCFVGLPISMLTLKTLGEIISKVVYKFVYMVETKVFCRRRPRRVKIKSFFVTFTLMILTLCLGGITQIYMESWTFIEGFYAWFATLSTIGYGDYIPSWNLVKNSEDLPVSKTSLGLIISASALPSLAALSVVSGVLNSLVEALEEFRIQIRSCFKCPGYQKRKSSKLNEPPKENSASGDPIQSRSKADITICSERARSSTV